MEPSPRTRLGRDGSGPLAGRSSLCRTLPHNRRTDPGT